MRSRQVLLVIGLSALALGGCEGKSAKPATTAAAAPNAAPPVRKPGLWKIDETFEGVPGISSMSMCLDEATDKELSWWGPATGKGGCQEQTLTKTPDGAWAFYCKASGGAGAVTTRGTARGDFENAYVVNGQIAVTGSPDPQLSGSHKFSVAATRSGECPLGMAPGMADVPGAGRIDLLNMAKAQK